MDEKFKYRYDAVLNVLYKYYYGAIGIDDIASSWKYAFDNKLIPKDTRGFILDYREANFKIEIDEHTAIADFYRNHLEVFGNKKIAILTNDPKDVVIPVLVESIDDGYISKPFSTMNAALNWVLS
ncbi:MAG: hypothetical protein ACERKD_06570 [Prolixibacteraceae bacterium]